MLSLIQQMKKLKLIVVQNMFHSMRHFLCSEAFWVLFGIEAIWMASTQAGPINCVHVVNPTILREFILFKCNHRTNHSNSKKNINGKRSRWSWWSSTKGAGVNLSWSMVVRAGHSHRQTSFSQPIENFPACLFKSSLRCFVIVRLLDVGIEDAIDGWGPSKQLLERFLGVRDWLAIHWHKQHLWKDARVE